MTIPKYREWKETKDQDKLKKGEATNTKTPTEMIDAGYESIKQSVEKQLHKEIKNCPPVFFEQLVVKLMRKMGYGINDRKCSGVLDPIWEQHSPNTQLPILSAISQSPCRTGC